MPSSFRVYKPYIRARFYKETAACVAQLLRVVRWAIVATRPQTASLPRFCLCFIQKLIRHRVAWHFHFTTVGTHISLRDTQHAYNSRWELADRCVSMGIRKKYNIKVVFILKSWKKAQTQDIDTLKKDWITEETWKAIKQRKELLVGKVDSVNTHHQSLSANRVYN